MKNLSIFTGIILLIFQMLLSFHSYSQPKAKVENVDFFLEGETLVITYDLSKGSSGGIFKVSVRITTTTGKNIPAFSLTGDIGAGVASGKAKRIIWDLKKDNAFLDDEILVEVTAYSEKDGQQVNVGRALLRSLLLPGLGNSYVKGGGAYWLIGVVAYGTLAGSVAYNNMAYNAYEDYKNAANASDRDTFFKDAENFKQTQTNLAIAAGAIWAADLIWTGIQAGSANKKAPGNKVSVGYYYDPVVHQPLLRFSYTFK